MLLREERVLRKGVGTTFLTTFFHSKTTFFTFVSFFEKKVLPISMASFFCNFSVFDHFLTGTERPPQGTKTDLESVRRNSLVKCDIKKVVFLCFEKKVTFFEKKQKR